MAIFNEGFNETYKLGALSINLFQPKNRKCQDDYLIRWEGTHQFSDVHLFNDISNNINNINEMNIFLNYFKQSGFVLFDNEFLQCNLICRNSVIDYVNSLNLNDILKTCLASMIFRCHIDNINYSWANGCIRHYIQILMLFGYKFDIDIWKMIPLPNIDICKEIYDAGYNTDKSIFRTQYITLKQNNQL